MRVCVWHARAMQPLHQPAVWARLDSAATCHPSQIVKDPRARSSRQVYRCAVSQFYSRPREKSQECVSSQSQVGHSENLVPGLRPGNALPRGSYLACATGTRGGRIGSAPSQGRTLEGMKIVIHGVGCGLALIHSLNAADFTKSAYSGTSRTSASSSSKSSRIVVSSWAVRE